jgi:hypothetical protein
VSTFSASDIEINYPRMMREENNAVKQHFPGSNPGTGFPEM